MNAVQPVKIIHLGQANILPFGVEPCHEVAERIVNSQIKVANYIKKHPEAIVFLEGFVVNWSGIPDDSMTYEVARLFPNGLPEDADKLTLPQKKFLSEKAGAVTILNRLGQLKSIYRTISPEESKINHSKLFETEDSFYMYESRERAAMASIQEVLKDNPSIKKVILVFGNAHDFSPYCHKYGFEHKKISYVHRKVNYEEVEMQRLQDEMQTLKLTLLDNKNSRKLPILRQ